MTPRPARIIIGIASNMVYKELSVQSAVEALRNIFPSIRVSTCMQTAPIEGIGREYANAVAVAETHFSPETVVRVLKLIESMTGRQKLNRDDIPLDLDLLDYDGLSFPTLKLPRHSQMNLEFNRRAIEELGIANSLPAQNPINN